MAIYGTGSPKFMSAIDSSMVKLDHAIILERKLIKGFLQKISPLDNWIFFIGKKQNMKVRIKVHLWKYENDTPSILPEEKHAEILAHFQTPVFLWLHSDGEPFQDSDEENVPFFFSEYSEVYETTTDYKDSLIITLLSTRPVDTTKSVVSTFTGSYLIDGEENFIVDKEGNKIVSNN